MKNSETKKSTNSLLSFSGNTGEKRNDHPHKYSNTKIKNVNDFITENSNKYNPLYNKNNVGLFGKVSLNDVTNTPKISLNNSNTNNDFNYNITSNIFSKTFNESKRPSITNNKIPMFNKKQETPKEDNFSPLLQNKEKKDNTQDLKMPLLSTIMINATPNLTLDSLVNCNNNIFKNYSDKRELNEKTPQQTSPNKLSNFFILEYEKKVNNCDCNCVNTCSRSKYKEFLTFENEEIFENASLNRIYPSEYISSSKSYLFLVLSLIISAFHFGLYRRVAQKSKLMYNVESMDNNNNNQNADYFNIYNFISEINTFTWRYQIICLFLIIYVYISNFFIKKNYEETLEGRLTLLNEIRAKNHSFGRDSKTQRKEKSLHLFDINLEDLISIEKFKDVSILMFSSFLLFFSSYFIPVSLSLAINYLTILMKYFFNLGLNYEIKANKLFRLIIYLFSIIGILLALSNNFMANERNMTSKVYISPFQKKNSDVKHNESNLNYWEIQNDLSYADDISFSANNSSDFDKIANHQVMKDIEKSKKADSFVFNFIGISLSFISGLINIFICQDIFTEFMTVYSPIEFLLILNIHSAILSSIINMILNTYLGNPFNVILWIREGEVGLNYLHIILGLIAFINIQLTIFSSVYLNKNYLKVIKIIEIPLADSIMNAFLSNSNYSHDISYYLGIINILIVIILIEFAELFVDKKKSKKYDF